MPSKPNLFYALCLRCLYCGKTRLRASGSWFAFAPGCPSCNYKYEREPGYFTGASWMVNYSLTALVGILLAVVLVFKFPDTDGSLIAAFLAVFIVGFGAWFMPFAKAIWMYADHLLHQLSDADKLV